MSFVSRSLHSPLKQALEIKQRLHSWFVLGDWEKIFQDPYPQERGHSFQPKRQNFVGGLKYFFSFFFESFCIYRFVGVQWKFFWRVVGRDHCFSAPLSWFLHETGLESLKNTSARCFSLTCQRKDSKKAKEHRQFVASLGAGVQPRPTVQLFVPVSDVEKRPSSVYQVWARLTKLWRCKELRRFGWFFGYFSFSEGIFRNKPNQRMQFRRTYKVGKFEVKKAKNKEAVSKNVVRVATSPSSP